MALSKQQLAALSAAKKRRKLTTIDFEVDEELTVGLTFESSMTINALDIIDAVVGGDISDSASMAVRGKAVRSFLMELASDETIEWLEAAEADKLIGLSEYASIQKLLVEAIAGRPTTRSSSLEDG